MYQITEALIEDFRKYLINEEKSQATIEKYIRDLSRFSKWCAKREIEKGLVVQYKKLLISAYAPTSVNSIVSSLNAFFEYAGWIVCKTKTLRIQKQVFIEQNKELSKEEYKRLLTAAKQKGNERLYLIIRTICSTGIRVSELKYITCESLKKGKAIVNCKNKMRVIFIPKEIIRLLVDYAKSQKIVFGSVFVSKNGIPLDRSNIWTDMKKLCVSANVQKEKVFPHNLRHLFARTFYSLEKDIVRLSDILGHTSINTTRIYTIETGEVHKNQMQKIVELLC